MRILGLDPGLRLCGYALIETDSAASQPRLIEAGVIRSNPRQPLEKRLAQIATDLQTILTHHQPAIAAIEQLYAHYQHPRTAILMGHCRGVLLQQTASFGCAVFNYSATRIKKALTGNGRASKTQIQRAIQTMLTLPTLPEPPDVADAAAVALCAARDRRIWQQILTAD